jgi:hypothetical protein
MAITNNTEAPSTLYINAPIGTPQDGQKIMFRIQSTNSQLLSFDSIFRQSADLLLPTATTGSGRVDYIGFIYNSSFLKWDHVARTFGF